MAADGRGARWATQLVSATKRKATTGLLVLVGLFVAVNLHQHYAWQIILFQEIISPGRTECVLPNVGAPPSPVAPPDHGELKIGILLLIDKHMWGSDGTKHSIENKRAYSSRHGYELIIATGSEIDRSRPAAWSKIRALLRHLPHFDYIMFTDADTLFTNFETPLQHLIVDREKDLIMTEDWNGLNTGVFIVRNSPWSSWLLDEAWGYEGSEQEYMATHETSRKGIKYPFEYEQRAFHYIFQTNVWKERGLPAYKQTLLYNGQVQSQDELWSHLVILPQCSMNAYMLYPFSFRFAAESQWIPSDLIVHMAGHKDPNKRELFEYCYGRATAAERQMTSRTAGRLGA